jgi:hypothetical protein
MNQKNNEKRKSYFSFNHSVVFGSKIGCELGMQQVSFSFILHETQIFTRPLKKLEQFIILALLDIYFLDDL